MSAPLPTPRKRAPAVTPRLAVTRGSRTAARRAVTSGPSRILVVDDDPSLRALFANFLRHAGYDVIEAQDGDDALAALANERTPVDLLVTDVVMPHTGGPALVERLRARVPGIPVLYLSGYAVDTDVADDATADTAHLQKPLTRSALLAEVAALLGNAPAGPPPA
jgi:two-component system, cell cycle sensor histidine kinase and response regulator CckA